MRNTPCRFAVALAGLVLSAPLVSATPFYYTFEGTITSVEDRAVPFRRLWSAWSRHIYLPRRLGGSRYTGTRCGSILVFEDSVFDCGDRLL